MVSSWKKSWRRGCWLAKRCVLHCLLVDIVSLLYACWIYHRNFPRGGEERLLPLYGLCVAKCHGLAASLVFIVAGVDRCHSLKRCVNIAVLQRVMRQVSSSRITACLSPSSSGDRGGRRLSVDVFPRERHRGNVHVVDGSRWLASGLLHAAVHISLTHPLSALPAFPTVSDDIGSVNLLDFIRFAFANYRWTVSGYLLMFFAVAIVALGVRLLAFARCHTIWRNLHVSSYVCSTAAMFTHSSNYLVLAVTATILVAELAATLLLVERVRLVKMEVVHAGANYSDATASSVEDMVELQFTSQRFSRRFRCGDYVRLYVPSVAWLETHAFSVVPHLRKANTYRVFVRAVGRWTRRLASARNLRHVYVIGPFGNDGEVSLGRLLYISHDQLEAGERPFYFIDGTWSLNLVCTGIAITRHLAILAHLVACYENRTTGCCAVRNYANMRVPGRVRLIWLVRKSFDVNLAIAMLNDMQRKLEACGWPCLLSYDIFVSREPTELELTGNTRRQLEMLERGRLYSMCEQSYDDDVDDDDNNDVHQRLEHVLYDYARNCGERLDAKRSWRLSSADMDEHANRLRNFYQRTNLRVGARAENWRQLLHTVGAGDEVAAMRNDSGETVALSPEMMSQPTPNTTTTTTVLTTAIQSVANELRRLHGSSSGGDALHVESLW